MDARDTCDRTPEHERCISFETCPFATVAQAPQVPYHALMSFPLSSYSAKRQRVLEDQFPYRLTSMALEVRRALQGAGKGLMTRSGDYELVVLHAMSKSELFAEMMKNPLKFLAREFYITENERLALNDFFDLFYGILPDNSEFFPKRTQDDDAVHETRLAAIEAASVANIAQRQSAIQSQSRQSDSHLKRARLDDTSVTPMLSHSHSLSLSSTSKSALDFNHFMLQGTRRKAPGTSSCKAKRKGLQIKKASTCTAPFSPRMHLHEKQDMYELHGIDCESEDKDEDEDALSCLEGGDDSDTIIAVFRGPVLAHEPITPPVVHCLLDEKSRSMSDTSIIAQAPSAEQGFMCVARTLEFE